MGNPSRDGILPRARAQRAGPHAAWIVSAVVRRASIGACVLMILALCGVWSPHRARAAPRDGVPVGGYAQVVGSPILHLRAGPALEYAIIVTMPQGAVVRVLDGPFEADGYEWMRVSYDGTTGFAADQWLAPAGAPVGGPRSDVAPGSRAYVANTIILHERSGPGLHYTIIVTMPQGAVVTVDHDGPYPADGYEWYHVSYAGTTGYAAGNWLAPDSDHAGFQPGSASSVSVTSSTVVVGGYAKVVNNSILHLRSGPGTHYSVIETMPEGGIVQIEQGPEYGDAYTWWCVTYNGTRGYAAAPWLAPSEPPWS